ncbi:hypothetical protein [Sorangium cellulosum]|uniref:Uncharacterized protein n=1 Tax=Sorangium cellulosum TaxID=56 RepID=A0A150QI83_SORCE|nr:hypothetical protein [Sorangium cellulosum]KYF67664.1 hypothetical protein BE15_25930 [Sorangium cellulosum]
MFFNASAAWYAGRYVAPSGSPVPSKSEQNVALGGHAPVGVPAPVLDVVLVVLGVPVAVLVVALGSTLPVVVVLPGLPLLVLPDEGLPAPELTLEAPPVPAPPPPAPPVSEGSELPPQPAAAAASARQEIPTRVKRAVSR